MHIIDKQTGICACVSGRKREMLLFNLKVLLSIVGSTYAAFGNYKSIPI